MRRPIVADPDVSKPDWIKQKRFVFFNDFFNIKI